MKVTDTIKIDAALEHLNNIDTATGFDTVDITLAILALRRVKVRREAPSNVRPL